MSKAPATMTNFRSLPAQSGEVSPIVVTLDTPRLFGMDPGGRSVESTQRFRRLATVALVLGLVPTIVTGVVAVVLGAVAMRRAGVGSAVFERARLAAILGTIWIVVTAAYVVIALVLQAHHVHVL